MTRPGSRPPGVTAQAGLVLRCPECERASEDIGSGTYRCTGSPRHVFKAGKCDECGRLATVYDTKFRCTHPEAHKQ